MPESDDDDYCIVDAPDCTPAHLDFIAGAKRCFDYARQTHSSAMKTLFTQIGQDYLKIAYEEAMPPRRAIASPTE
jgi:hypothetical protein